MDPQPSTSAGANTPIGIDLGTTTCALAQVVGEDRVECYPLDGESKLIPSALFIEERIEAGRKALELGLDRPDSVVEAFKRDMGEPHFNRKIRHQWVPPEVLSALLLDEIRQRARKYVGNVRDAVITVPAYFDERRRKATLEAGRLAGLNVTDIVNEPVAAALAEFHHAGLLTGNQKEPSRILVYDLGGGTFDVSVLEVVGNDIITRASDGDVRLGGRDFDERLVEYIAERFHEHHGVDPRSDFGFLQRLWTLAQNAKHELTNKPSTNVVCSFAGMRLGIEVTREQFDNLIEPLIERTIVTSMDVLEQAGLVWRQLDRVLLVGGSSRIPLVYTRLSQAAGRPPILSREPDLAVAMGAALFAALKTSKTLSQLKVINVNAHSLGIAGIDVSTGEPVNRILIPRNSQLPASTRQKFVTRRKNQRTVDIKIVEGENENPNYCVPVGKCIVTLGPDLPERTEVQITCRYSSNGTISVSALVPLTKESAHVEVRRDGFMELESLPVWRERLVGGAAPAVVLSNDLPKVAPIASPDPSDHVQVLKRIDYLCQEIGEQCVNSPVPAGALAMQRQVIGARREYQAIQHLLGKVRTAMATERDTLQKSKLQSSAAALRSYQTEVERLYIYARIAFGAACVSLNVVPEDMKAEGEEVSRLTATIGEWAKKGAA
jgi:molecular chaperone DnaK